VDALEGIPTGQFDVVLMDVCLPVISGIECARKLKAILPNLSVIMVAGCIGPALMFEALAAGASGCLAKPLTPSACQSAIDEVLKGGAPLCGEAAAFLLNFFRQATTPIEGPKALTDREKEVIACLVQGNSDREIADILGIGLATVHTHMHRMFAKLGVSDRRSAVIRYASLPQRTPVGGQFRL
jgi:DNA-binding NarL/FixJ family response regulator